MINDTLTSYFLNLSNFQLAWQKVATNNGCAGVDGETIAQFGARADENLAKLLKAVAIGKYHPMPLLQFFIPKKHGGWRSLAVPTVRDRIVQQALLQVLHPVIEQEFEACSFAYRPGRSHLMAVQQVAQWHSRGYKWILDADVVKYFDNLGHPRLLAEVAERLNHPLVLSLVAKWISAGVLTREGLILPNKGIPQGAVISPLLANIYLDDFDEIFSRADLKLVRFADDFVLMARSQKRIEQALAEVEQVLNSMGLQLHPDKTQITNFERGFRFLGNAFSGNLILPIQSQSQQLLAKPVVEANSSRLVYIDSTIQPTAMEKAMVDALKVAHQPIPPPFFVVLGYKVREEKPVVIESSEVNWKPGMSTLYLVHQGTILRREQRRFLLQTPKEVEIEIPIREVERILVFGNIQLTTTAISACLEAQIIVVFLTQTGEYKGHLWTSEFCDIKTQQAQFLHQDDDCLKLEIAKAIVYGKLMNSKQLLLRLNRKRQIAAVADVITKITEDIAVVETVDNLNSLRGYEGIGAARYFSAFGQLIVNSAFTFTHRNRRPPKDPVNSLLSFGYTLLFNNVLSLLLAEGLNPYLGNLHGSDRKELFLAFDLVEEFRSPIVDSLILKLVNKNIIRPTDFTWPNAEGGVYLTEQARRMFIQKIEERLSEEISHPDVQTKVSLRRVIQLQIKRYKHCLLESVPYQTFLRSV